MHTNKTGFNILHQVGFNKNHKMLLMVEAFIMTEFPFDLCHEQIFNMLATAKTQRGFTPCARGPGPDVKSINKRLAFFREHGLPEIQYGSKRQRNDEQQRNPYKYERLIHSKVTHDHFPRSQTGLPKNKTTYSQTLFSRRTEQRQPRVSRGNPRKTSWCLNRPS